MTIVFGPEVVARLTSDQLEIVVDCAMFEIGQVEALRTTAGTSSLRFPVAT